MADEERPRRSVSLGLTAFAVVGWLAAGLFWWQGAQTQSLFSEQLTVTEKARESLASDLQNLQKSAGAAADLNGRPTLKKLYQTPRPRGPRRKMSSPISASSSATQNSPFPARKKRRAPRRGTFKPSMRGLRTKPTARRLYKARLKPFRLS